MARIAMDKYLIPDLQELVFEYLLPKEDKAKAYFSKYVVSDIGYSAEQREIHIRPYKNVDVSRFVPLEVVKERSKNSINYWKDLFEVSLCNKVLLRKLYRGDLKWSEDRLYTGNAYGGGEDNDANYELVGQYRFPYNQEDEEEQNKYEDKEYYTNVYRLEDLTH